MFRKSLATVAVAFSAIGLSAQSTSSPSGLIGFTSGATTSPLIQRQVICRPSTRVCGSGLSSASNWAGGAAFNAIQSSVWHTQGSRMAEIRVSDCRLLCSTPAHLILGTGSVASGLALSEARNELYQLEAIRGTAALHTRHLRSCVLNVLSSCRIALPSARHSAGAVAIDQRTGVFYYATSVFPTTGSTLPPQNIILVAKASRPCDIICRFSVQDCKTNRLGPITAMAFDACSGLLYVSDGKMTSVHKRSASDVLSSSHSASRAPVGVRPHAAQMRTEEGGWSVTVHRRPAQPPARKVSWARRTRTNSA